jgi:hypothetical protein
MLPVKFFMGKNEDCGECAHEFLKMEYDKAVLMIEKLSSYKLSYQRIFIAMFASIGAITLAFLKIPTSSSAGEIIAFIGLEHLLGLLLISTSAMGYVIVKNLASTRISEIFFCRSIKAIRALYKSQLGLPENYPDLRDVKVNEATSADYHTIIACSIFNALYFVCGVALLFYDNLSGRPIPFATVCFSAGFIYFLVHLFQIQKYMVKGDQKFSIV